jgi:Spy/CpxP family protein refolding chaperone
MRKVKTIVITVVSVAVIGFSVNAFAHGGMGYGDGWGHHGPGWHHRGAYGPGYNADSMTQEEFELFQSKREAFLKDTEALRTNLYDKERELQNELAKTEPDVKKASGLQKEISELRADLDQKRISHRIEMRKLNPNAGRGFMRGGPMMQGYGPRGGGHCWE